MPAGMFDINKNNNIKTNYIKNFIIKNSNHILF